MKRPKDLKRGDKFIVTNNNMFRKGEIIELVFDDTTDKCLYENTEKETWYIPFNHLEPVEKTLKNLVEGDVVLDCDDHEETVLAVGSDWVLTDDGDYKECYNIDFFETNGYTVKQESEVIELTLEDIAELKGVSVDQIKIVKGN